MIDKHKRWLLSVDERSSMFRCIDTVSGRFMVSRHRYNVDMVPTDARLGSYNRRMELLSGYNKYNLEIADRINSSLAKPLIEVPTIKEIVKQASMSNCTAVFSFYVDDGQIKSEGIDRSRQYVTVHSSMIAKRIIDRDVRILACIPHVIVKDRDGAISIIPTTTEVSRFEVARNIFSLRDPIE